MASSEQQKYERIWQEPDYRRVAPGEHLVNEFLKYEPRGTILDIGCGTGRASLLLAELGYDVLLTDIARNCLDEEVSQRLGHKFTRMDVTQRCPFEFVNVGFCTDMMEHLPPNHVDLALANMFGCCEHMFFQINFQAAHFDGKIDGHQVHLTVRPFRWWRNKLRRYSETLDARDWIGEGIFYCRRTAAAT